MRAFGTGARIHLADTPGHTRLAYVRCPDGTLVELCTAMG